MKLYNALIKKNQEGKIADIVLLKEGFSTVVFLFSGLWFLYHKMWKEFVVIIVINFAFVVFATISSPFDKFAIQFAFVLMVALNANHWLCEHLKNKGYEFVELVFGSDLESARFRFINNLQSEENRADFDDSILNPKLYRRMMKLKKT
jgi:hypothetical protein